MVFVFNLLKSGLVSHSAVFLIASCEFVWNANLPILITALTAHILLRRDISFAMCNVGAQ